MAKLSPLLALTFCSFLAWTQPQARIALVSQTRDTAGSIAAYRATIQNEILALTKNNFLLEFDLIDLSVDVVAARNQLDKLFADDKNDIVVGTDTYTSSLLAARRSYAKPTIAAVIINAEQQVPTSAPDSSGIANFTYVQSPFSIERDLAALHGIRPYERLAVIGGSTFTTIFPFFEEMVQETCQRFGASFDLIPYQPSIAATMALLPTEADAVYVPPLFDDVTENDLLALFDSLNQRKILTGALLGEDYVEAGALMGYEANSNLQRMPRRVGIQVSKILEGTPASSLSVIVPTYNEHMLLNMETARRTGIYPNWDIIGDAILLNYTQPTGGQQWTLRSLIIKALQHNLEFLATQKQPQIAEKDVDLAKADLRPQLSASSSLSTIDATRAENSFGTQGRTNWLAGATLSQVIYSEPALANIAIQDLLQQSAEREVQQAYLDVILDASVAYLNVLQAQSFLEIRLQNETLNRDNYDISKAKEAVGYAGASDLNRWRSELALASAEVNDAAAQLEQAKLAVNQLLNRPLDETFELEETTISDQVLLVTDPRMLTLIDNPGKLEVLADFLVEEALRNAPEIAQVQYGLDIQERLALSQRRSFYLPSIALSGQLDQTIRKWSVTEIPGTPLPANKPTWSLGLGLQYNIFEGNRRKLALQQTQLNALQLRHQLDDVRNKIALNLRSALATAGASFSRVELYREAAEAAAANFDIVQDLYSQGSVNITTLIDAQNAALQTELSAQNAAYQFVVDFLVVERASGAFYFLETPNERTAFFDRLLTFLGQHGY